MPLTAALTVTSGWFIWYMHAYTKRLMAASQTVRRAF